MNEIEKIIRKIKIRGIIRNVDELGRVVIPKEFRKNVKDGETKVSVYSIKNYVVIEILDNQLENNAKRFDELGRVVINKEIRDELSWKEKDEIEVWNIQKYFILKKVEDKCIFCGKKKDLLIYKGKLVCEECKEEIGGVNEYV